MINEIKELPGMKVLHIGQMIGGLDIYIRNSITFASGNIEYIIMHGTIGDESPTFPAHLGNKCRHDSLSP